ncbi:hypothetical protein EFK50_01020 [Nocardioides marmoriginsengisoli]|uniref:Phage tail tape measure protein n=1 Tax=Nocardioides marmoriginsengisoli TaxID=661483 RepID=A0A3N0CS00_9ACTN|nr:hypothetical protein EFK50_01020 [Nocardioides marmoriginsengisoli]
MVLELEDQFTAPIIRAAAATELLNKRLDGLSHEAVQSSKATRDLDRDVDGVGKTSRRTEKDIDRLSGRLRILAEVAAILGPAFVPIGAVAVPAVTGLASALGFAAFGAGTAVLAFQGVGDALKAVNKAALEPTTANLTAAREAMAQISPEARRFVRELRSMVPELKELRDLAATGLFPGLTEGLDGLEGALPRVERIVSAISTELGTIAGDAGQSLGSDRWAPFLDFVAVEGPSALADFATAAGNTAHALAGLGMSTTPLNQDFSRWLIEATADLDRWANGLGQTEGFAEFLAYVEETGPQVADTLGALGDAALQIVEAAAPLGGPVLQGLEAVANVLSAIADSDLGTPIFAGLAALSLYNRALKVTASLQASALGQKYLPEGGFSGSTLKSQIPTMQQFGTVAYRVGQSSKYASDETLKARESVRTFGATAGRSVAPLAGLAVASTGAADKIGLTNTVSLALAGTMAGPWGAALGAGAGFLLDAKASSDSFAASLREIDRAITSGNLDTLQAQLAAANKELDDAQHHDGLGDTLSDIFNGDWRSKATFIPVVGGWISSLGGVETAADRAQEKIDRINTGTNLARANAQADLLAAGFKATAAGIDTASMSVDQFTASLERAYNAINSFDAATSYAAAVDDFTKGLKDNGRTLDINTEKGRANRDGLTRIAKEALELSKTLTGQEKFTFMDQARDDFIKAQIAAGKSRAAAKAFADQVGLVNQAKGVAKIDLNKVAAERKLATFSVALDGFVRKKRTIHVGLNVDKPSGKFDILGNLGESADGTTVPKTGLPYADRHLYLLADGEEVVSNRHGQADRHRGLLKAINDGRLADGGTAGRYPSGLSSYIRDDLDMKFPTTLRQWNKAIAASTKVVEKETSKRQALLDQAQSVRDSISSNYNSDLFGKTDSSVWMSAADRMKAGKGDVFSTLTGDIGSLRSLESAIDQLTAKGLDSDALAYLLSEGSLQDVQNFATGPKADVARYESLYNQRDRLTTSVGNAGAAAAFGPALATSKAQLATLNRLDRSMQRVGNLLEKNPNATGAAIARAINGVGPKRPKGKR